MDFSERYYLVPRWVIRVTLAVFALLLCSTVPIMVAAQSAVELGVAQKDWYANYATSQFAIDMPFTSKNATNLRQRIRRFHYRLLYVPIDSVTSSQSIIRIGFFESEAEATEYVSASDFLFDGQQVIRVDRAEHTAVVAELDDSGDSATQSRYYVFPINPESGDTLESKTSLVLEQAKTLYMEKQYAAAAAHYKLLSSLADEKTAAWAKELLGLCYEKMENYSLAIQTYGDLLVEFPETSGRPRVDQRLRALISATEEGKAAFRKSNAVTGGTRYFSRGVISQFYRGLTRQINDEESEDLMSLLSTNFDFRGSVKWSDHEVRGRLSGFSIQDNLEEGDDSETRLNRGFIDYLHKKSGLNVQLGRLRDFDSGVFVPYDGASISYPIVESLSISASAGRPVYFTDVYEELDYSFVSAQVAWDIRSFWQTGAYYTKQTLFDVTDREALGLRTNYYKDRVTASFNIDYDLAFAELNNLLSNASYKFNDKASVSATLGHQRSPFLTATNILIGQSDLDLETYLESQQNKDSLLDDAFERTSLNQYVSLSVSYKVREKMKVIADYYLSNLTDIPSSAFLLGEELSADSEENDFEQQAVGLQVVNQSLFHKNDSATVGFKLRSSTNSSTTQLFFIERLRFGNVFSISPKLSYLSTQFEVDRDSQQQFRYSLNMSYKPFRNMELSLEGGNEHFEIEDGSFSYDSTYFFLGYRFNF